MKKCILKNIRYHIKNVFYTFCHFLHNAVQSSGIIFQNVFYKFQKIYIHFREVFTTDNPKVTLKKNKMIILKKLGGTNLN